MDNGRQDLIISSVDGPNRVSTIDCGPKLANLRRYWRDYYVDPSRMGTSSSSGASDSASSTTSDAAVVTVNAEEEDSKNTTSSSYNDGSDSDGLHDSLDDAAVPDSGIGSSSERGPAASLCNKSNKVGAEIEKFQKEIEKANVEKIKAVDWSEKKKQVQSRRSASTDSLLSMDGGSDSSSNLPPPALPPKGRFVSSDNLSPSPPALPPKKNNSNLNKRVSISTVCISSATCAPNNYESDCLTDGSVAERIKNFMSKTQ